MYLIITFLTSPTVCIEGEDSLFFYLKDEKVQKDEQVALTKAEWIQNILSSQQQLLNSDLRLVYGEERKEG